MSSYMGIAGLLIGLGFGFMTRDTYLFSMD